MSPNVQLRWPTFYGWYLMTQEELVGWDVGQSDGDWLQSIWNIHPNGSSSIRLLIIQPYNCSPNIYLDYYGWLILSTINPGLIKGVATLGPNQQPREACHWMNLYPSLWFFDSHLFYRLNPQHLRDNILGITKVAEFYSLLSLENISVNY